MKRMKLAMAPLLAVFALSAVAQEGPRQREGRYDEQIRKQATEELQKESGPRQEGEFADDERPKLGRQTSSGSL